jgi:LPXTG-motif cell wall-anchored protein
MGVLLGVLVLGVTPVADAGWADRDGGIGTDDQGGAASVASATPAVEDAAGAFVQFDEKSELAQQSEQAEEADRVKFQITVHENGTAVWTFRYERHLANESERQQFESFAQEFNQNDSHPTYVGFKDQASALVAAGDEQTDRQMAANSFRRNATVEQQINQQGVVSMSFHWENFARGDGERLIVGDVFEGGLFLSEEQWLIVERGDGLAFSEVDPTGELSGDTMATSDTVTWTGAKEFTDNRPRIVLAPEGSVDESPGTNTAPATDDSNPWMLLAGIVVLLLGVASAVAWRRDGSLVARSPSGSVDEDAAVEQVAADDAADAEAGGDTAVTDEELMTDEDQVTALLEENGGRMKQVNIVEETGWSKSKVSMLLSDMEEDGDISKLRVGRENIISLDGHEPEAAGSPFENED